MSEKDQEQRLGRIEDKLSSGEARFASIEARLSRMEPLLYIVLAAVVGVGAAAKVV